MNLAQYSFLLDIGKARIFDWGSPFLCTLVSTMLQKLSSIICVTVLIVIKNVDWGLRTAGTDPLKIPGPGYAHVGESKVK